ncbi:histidine kinase [Novosphingobium sp. KCTC 2891]|uniref:histidine kinase dimerization/phospho-acceptor domain-containing protein n=1 Tax=Novosphingobium sp. KCTC 2891 TaxID=2989730 RepID=UPI00222174BF|nr:histidine kinase dimerization/phospho-acceptor domain-containing protein [Novosphingobium sp. KCTC 2891]MCW1384701.1 histidine kinase [Novosphingobium sp. KCTC 2891]
MIIDDRLETVLRTNAAGRSAMRVQFRQLADLLGRTPPEHWSAAQQAALERLDALGEALGDEDTASLLRSCALRSPRLVLHFARQGPRAALATIGAARLEEAAWLEVIPAMPVQARGVLRHRRDLGAAVESLLAQLGIDDFALPLPDGYVAEAPAAPEPAPVSTPTAPPPLELVTSIVPPTPTSVEREPEREGIGAIVRRIEAFRRQREAQVQAGEAAPAPAAIDIDVPEEPAGPALTSIDIRIDSDGMIVAADASHAPMLVGHRPFTGEVDAPATCDASTLRAFRARQPVEGGLMTFEGTAPIAGPWRVDAVPAFARDGGHYTGYHARLRRPEPARNAPAAANDDSDSSADRLRQLLHELRTPINAIQGFAELIQQQLFGPTPHQYRSLAASIAADAARMLAGFEEVERLVKLETGRIDHEEGETDLGEILARLVTQMEPVIGPREVRLKLTLPETGTPVAVAPLELERTLWRMLSVIAGTAAPGERLALSLASGAGYAHLVLPLPAALAMRDDSTLFAPDSSRAGGMPGQAMLGNGFALRLAAAEVRTAGGHLTRNGARILVDFPLAPGHRLTPDQLRAAAAGGGR